MSDFDPSYNYTKEQLLQVETPAEPDDFVSFWQARYTRCLSLQTHPQLKPGSEHNDNYDVFDLNFVSSDDIKIGGWALVPKNKNIKRGFIVGHGYGGRDAPDFDLPLDDAVILFPCFRGLSRSHHPEISGNASQHVIHNIHSRDHYVLGGCVEDLWLTTSALLELFPEVAGHVGYLGISFSGGIGALALPWEKRIQRAHLNIPSFGHNPLRLQLPSRGSANAVQKYQREHGNIADILSYYDAAIAAKHIHIPMHIAAALSDPVVAPPGQFSIYNALTGEKKLFVLNCGHSDCRDLADQQKKLQIEIGEFFNTL